MGLRLRLDPGRPRSAVASRPAGARAKPAKPGRRAVARRTLAAAAGDAARSFASSLQNRLGWFSLVLLCALGRRCRSSLWCRGALELRSKPAAGSISAHSAPWAEVSRKPSSLGIRLGCDPVCRLAPAGDDHAGSARHHAMRSSREVLASRSSRSPYRLWARGSKANCSRAIHRARAADGADCAASVRTWR